jgi:hypothetical protein
MTAVVGRLSAAFLECKKLVAKIDESRGLVLAAKAEVEQATVECERLFNIADLERNGLKPTARAFFALGMGTSKDRWCEWPNRTGPVYAML